MADIIIYVHDSSDTNSFSYISNLRVSHGRSALAGQFVKGFTEPRVGSYERRGLSQAGSQAGSQISVSEQLQKASRSSLQQQYSLDHIPAMFVATKSDLDLAQQRHEVQPDVYCRRLGLPAPMAVSARLGNPTVLWTGVTRVALNP